MIEGLAAAYVGMSITTFRNEVAKGRGPKPIRLTTKRIAWLRDDLDGWLDRLAGKVAASEAVDPDEAWKKALRGGTSGHPVR
jgi:predicted DNA-binding transcriptional regulator AlpA